MCNSTSELWGQWWRWRVLPTEIRVTTVGLMRKLERAGRCMITPGGEIEGVGSLQYHRHTPPPSLDTQSATDTFLLAYLNLTPEKLLGSILIWIEMRFCGNDYHITHQCTRPLWENKWYWAPFFGSFEFTQI